MRKHLFLTVALLSVVLWANGQDHSILIGVHTDLMKTDHAKVFDKAQFGIEGNYIINKDFTATAGFDVWTADEFSFIAGARWYPSEEAFLRLRGYVGQNDLSFGAGWAKPINEDFRFEAIGDFYFSIDFAIRVGVVYIIRR